MTHQPLSSTKAGRGANNPRSEGGYTFRAPRHSDLTRCTFCPSAMLNRLRCEYCGGEGVVFKGSVQ